MRLHVNDTSSVVGLKGARHHPSDFTLLPSLTGASLSVFPFHNLRTYGQSLLDPTPSRVSRPCLFGFSQLFRVRREECRPLSPLYELPRTMHSKQCFQLLLKSVCFVFLKSNPFVVLCQGSLDIFLKILCRSTYNHSYVPKSTRYLYGLQQDDYILYKLHSLLFPNYS